MIISGHGVGFILLLFLAFAGSLLLINAMIDLGSSRFRRWLASGAKAFAWIASHRPGSAHGRPIKPRPR